MKNAQKITIYLFFVSIFTAFLIWFCKSNIFTSVHTSLLKYEIFAIFKGNREFTVNLLLGISTSAWFATFGFYIDYKEKKRLLQEELVKVYVAIRNRCFSRMFYEKNSYDSDCDEVASIYDYLNEKKSLILDYRPLTLLIKVKMHRLTSKIRKKSEEKTDLTPLSLSNRMSLFEHTSEDKYALICSIFGDLYVYFGFINMYQSSIEDCSRLIKLYEEKMQRLTEADLKYDMYENMIKLQKQQRLIQKRKLLSRYPYNTTEFKAFVNKKDLVSKFYAADSKFPDYVFATYLVEILEPKDALVEDDDTLYSPDDERLKVNVVMGSST